MVAYRGRRGGTPPVVHTRIPTISPVLREALDQAPPPEKGGLSCMEVPAGPILMIANH
jgi:hypothetical protein